MRNQVYNHNVIQAKVWSSKNQVEYKKTHTYTNQKLETRFYKSVHLVYLLIAGMPPLASATVASASRHSKNLRRVQ